MRLLPGVEPITTPIGDYNMPYLYYLFFISRTNLYDLYMIKILSVVFDFVLALELSDKVKTSLEIYLTINMRSMKALQKLQQQK